MEMDRDKPFETYAYRNGKKFIEPFNTYQGHPAF